MARTLPALLAALLLCVLPGCGSAPRYYHPAAPVVEITEASGARHVAPAAAASVPCIKRQAGEYFPPQIGCEDEWWSYLVLLAVYAVIYVGYTIVYLFELMVEAAMADTSDSAGSNPAIEPSGPPDEWMP
ncbi:MAG: hypothetical protein HS108_15190 [Planctomycetes bacterium]|nr:hypothetical protein [Planctomycetota bacterium]MCL4730335.1 hypothetical protein [Planctomycetota bacterium]